MRKYKASEIVDRALHLADLTNTDFLTHKEHIDYLNDAWKNVYQFLISKGEKLFVNEVALNGASTNGATEFDLPDDFYQLQSLREEHSNRQISRKADSESDNSNTYEIVNDKLRVYGCINRLILTYYVAPQYITFPDRTIQLDYLVRQAHTSYGNSVYYTDTNGNRIIRNLIDGNVIEEGPSPSTVNFNNIGVTTSDAEVYDFNGNQLTQLGAYSSKFYTNIPGLFIRTNGDQDKWYVVTLNNATLVRTEAEQLTAYFKGKDGNVYYITEAWLYDIDGNVLLNSLTGNIVGITENGVVFSNNKILTITEEGKILYNDTPNKGYIAAINYGYVFNDRVESCYEDTLFNFPNDIYVSLLSYELALRYAQKQNSSTENLQAQLTQAQLLLSQMLNTDGKFKRITNSYR